MSWQDVAQRSSIAVRKMMTDPAKKRVKKNKVSSNHLLLITLIII